MKLLIRIKRNVVPLKLLLLVLLIFSSHCNSNKTDRKSNPSKRENPESGQEITEPNKVETQQPPADINNPNSTDKSKKINTVNQTVNGETSEVKFYNYELSEQELKLKTNFSLTNAMKLLSITSYIFLPCEFMINKLQSRKDVDNSITKDSCSKTSLHKRYYSIIKQGMADVPLKISKQQNERLVFANTNANSKDYTEGLNNLCNNWLEEQNTIDDKVKSEKIQEVDKDEQAQSLIESINVAKECYQLLVKINTGEDAALPVNCKEFLISQGCNVNIKSELKSCLAEKKTDNILVRDSLINIMKELGSIVIDPEKQHFNHPLLVSIEIKDPQNCEFPPKEQNVSINPIEKFAIRLNSLYSVFSKFLNCNGIFKSYMNIWTKISLNTVYNMILNMLSLGKEKDGIPLSEIKARTLVGGFISNTIAYFKYKNEIKKDSLPADTKSKLKINLSRTFGAAAGYLLRAFLLFFGDDWKEITDGKVADTQIGKNKPLLNWDAYKIESAKKRLKKLKKVNKKF